jgi:spore maturation protein CgeB
MFEPDILFAFKGVYVRASTLRTLRKQGLILYNYFPDPSPFAYDAVFPDSMPEYDCVFYTKIYWRDALFLKQFRADAFVAHGYDAEIHRPIPSSEDRSKYQHDVTVVATHSQHKEQVLDGLLSMKPSLDLVVWGNGWSESCRSNRVKKLVRGMSLNGTSYSKALASAKINLAIMHGAIYPGVSQADETSTRTYEIPACGGFMLHERSPELLTLFEEGKEVACFGSVEEAAEKIEYYLARPAEREAIARSGYARCVPAYSYDMRMRKVLEWHASHERRDSSINPQREMASPPL